MYIYIYPHFPNNYLNNSFREKGGKSEEEIIIVN